MILDGSQPSELGSLSDFATTYGVCLVGYDYPQQLGARVTSCFFLNHLAEFR